MSKNNPVAITTHTTVARRVLGIRMVLRCVTRSDMTTVYSSDAFAGRNSSRIDRVVTHIQTMIHPAIAVSNELLTAKRLSRSAMALEASRSASAQHGALASGVEKGAQVK